MATIELSLAEILTLEAELNGFVNPQTGEKVLDGFLKEKLNLTTKYWLSKLSSKLQSEKAILDKIKQDLIREYGEEKDGMMSIEMFEDEARTKVNPKFVEFQQKYAELLEEKREITYSPLKLSDLEEVKTNENYVVLFNLVADTI
jgi:hypothetical protein